MVNLVDESENEAEEVEMEEETRRKKKKKRSATASNIGETSSSKSPMKTGRKPDRIWKYVRKLKGHRNRVKCKLCEREFSGGAARIKMHLGKREGKDIALCERLDKLTKKKKKRKSFPPIEQEGTENVDATRSSPEREIQSDADFTIPLSPISLHPHDPNSNPVPSFPSSSCPQETTRINEEFTELVKHLVVNNVQFPTSHSILFKEALLSLEMDVEQYIDTVKESWRNTGLTLKIHLRESIYNECPEKSDLVGYTLYCPEGLIFLDIQKVSGEVKKAIEKEVTQILYDLDNENEHQQDLFLYVGNMVVTEFSKTISICAQAEILKLLRRVGGECKWLSDILMDAKNMFEVLRRAKKPLVASKFEHPLSELQAILQHKKELESTFYNRSETFWRRFWKDGEEALNAVRPLIQILGIFDCFVPSIGYFYEAIEMAEKRIKHHHEANPQKFKELWEQFGLLKPCVIWPIHVTSAYLNPSYTWIHNEWSNEDKINENEVRDYMKEFLIESNEEETLENELAKYRMKDSSLFTEEAISTLEIHHPVRWWEKFGEPTPLLRRCAIRLLSQPLNCLSHFCHKPKFEALKFERLDLLRLNVRMMEEFKELKEKDMIFKPIDLSKIDAPLN